MSLKEYISFQVIQKNVREARSKQSAMYAITAAEASFGLISSCLPSLLLKVMLNQLTRRYSLSLTHVDGELPVEGVDAVMYWRPPQGNCSKYTFSKSSSPLTAIDSYESQREIQFTKVETIVG